MKDEIIIIIRLNLILSHILDRNPSNITFFIATNYCLNEINASGSGTDTDKHRASGLQITEIHF